MAKTAVKEKQDRAAGKCAHSAYVVRDGALVCQACGEPSPRAKLVNGQIVRLPPTVKCPECGHEFAVPEKK